MRAELLVCLLLLPIAAADNSGVTLSASKAPRKVRLGNLNTRETGTTGASAQGERQPASVKAERGSRGVRRAAAGGGASIGATREQSSERQSERQALSVSTDFLSPPRPGAPSTTSVPPPAPAAEESGRGSQLPATAPTRAIPFPPERTAAPQPAPPFPPTPLPSPPQLVLTDDGALFFEGTGPAVLTPKRPKPPVIKKPVIRKSPLPKKSPKPLATLFPSPSPARSPDGAPGASGMFPNPALPPMPVDLGATFPGPHTTAIPSIVPSTDAIPVPSPSPMPDGATDDRQAELPTQPRPLASPRLPPRAPAAPQVPPPGTTSGSAWLLVVPTPLPSRWDSRDKRLTAGVSIISRVRFQASCNACVAFTVIAAAESAYALGARRAATNLDFSEQALFFCNSDIATRPPDCYQGWVLPDALQVLSQRGVRQERCYVYDVTRGSTVCGPAGAEERETLPGGEDASMSDASNSSSASVSTRTATAAPSACDPVPGRWEVVAREWYGVDSANATAAKEVVAGTGSAMTCFKLYADMYSHPGGVYRWDGESAWLGWHCAQLVGWSDDGGWWLFKSSWGTEVADKGFFKVAYGEAEVLAWGVYGLIWRP